jgi:protein SCO1/2
MTSLSFLAALLLVTAACTSSEPGGAAATPTAPGTAAAAATAAATLAPASASVAPGASGGSPSTQAPAATAAAATQAAPPASTASAGAAAPAAITTVISPAGLESPRPAPPLDGLIDADGSPFSLTDYRGTPTLVFFGYTHCPDVCPATIGEIFGVFQARPEAQAVFVSVDPERDSPEFLAKWTEYMPENFNAVTGTPGAIRRAADGYGVKYARVETTSTAGYTMSHTANVYLIDGDGQLRRTYPFGTPAAQMAADIATLQAG